MSTRMTIWNQGEYYKDLGESIISFNHKIESGPADNLIRIQDFNVLPDHDGHFVQSTNGKYSDDEMDAIRTFAISRRIIDILENYLNKPIRWQWSGKQANEPLHIFIRNPGINSRYLREQKCIELDFYGPYKDWTYYCRSVDIVAHETGHAILDGLKPGWYNANMETRGLAEAFCDFCAMLMITTNINLCAEVIRETKGDYKKSNILSLFGAGYGFEENRFSCIRDATQKVSGQRCSVTAYHYGEVLIGFLYEVLIEKAKKEVWKGSSPEKGLFDAAIPWSNAVVQAILNCNEEKSSIKEFAQHFQDHFPDQESVEKKLMLIQISNQP